MSGTDVALANELANAIEFIHNPRSTQEMRRDAFLACERFKEESPLCAQVGLYLATSSSYNDNVRHFGLQLTEYTIKYKWNSITQEEKVYIMNSVTRLLSSGIEATPVCQRVPLKDAISRCIVEMAKREWPQHWPTLLNELSQACAGGETQTEIVLKVFLRLVEDVALFQTIESNQRRKEMYQALTNNMENIFVFLMGLVEDHVKAYREAINQGRSTQESLAHSRVVEITLLTLSGFVEWVNVNHIVSCNGKLLQLLCILLNDNVFQYNAAECLAQITNRRGQIKERKALLWLFEEDLLRQICSSSQTSREPNLQDQTHHNFLKKLLQVLSGLAQQLVALWGKDEAITQCPTHFGIMLECLTFLVQHPSLTISHGAVGVWLILLKHDNCSKDAVVTAYIPKLIHVIGPRIIKQQYAKMEHPQAGTPEAYISMEYDSEEEFLIFYQRFRNDFLEVFRQATHLQPLITFAFCEQWLRAEMQNASSERVQKVCSIQDQLYLQWDALSYVLDAVLNRIINANERPPVASGLKLLDDCIKLELPSPLLYSVQLSCISSLFVFLNMSSNCITPYNVDLLHRVLHKIFNALVCKFPNESMMPQNSIKNLRRHASSLLVKLARKYSLLLLPIFDQINLHVKRLIDPASSEPQCRLVCTTLQEALLLISNHLCDYERQKMFIGEIVQKANTEWSGLSVVFSSALTFMQFIGLDKMPVQPIEHDPAGPNRMRIAKALLTVLGVVKRCTWPSDPELAQRGGFVVDRTDTGNPIYQNPASTHIIPTLQFILPFVRVLNEMFTPNALAVLSEGYCNVHDMLEQEKTILMGICTLPVDVMDPNKKTWPTTVSKMQSFMTMLSDNCCHLLGSAGPSLGWDLYRLNGLCDAMIKSAFAYLDIIPDYRLRPIIRVFLKPFISSCPSILHEQVLLPIFVHIAPIMHERLTTRWLYISSLYKSGQLTADVNDTKEVLEDQLNRSVTRDYLEVIKVALIGGKIGGETMPCPIGDDMNMDIIEESSMDGIRQSRATQSAMLSDIVSDLGVKLLRNNVVRNYVLSTILSSIAWNDGNSSMKAVNIAAPVMRFLVSENLIEYNQALESFDAVLCGLQVHGQHDANQSGLLTLGIQFYELLQTKYHTTATLQTLPNVNAADIQRLNEKISAAPVKGNKVDRDKKELFKKIVSPLIGRSVNEWFRNKIQIANLPPIERAKFKSSGDILLEHNENANISQLFTNS